MLISYASGITYCILLYVRPPWERTSPMKTNPLQSTGRATLIYLTHMAWVSGVLLVLGGQQFPWCCFEAAVILLGFRTVEITRDLKLLKAPVKARRAQHARTSR
jgi:hypothetical protein